MATDFEIRIDDRQFEEIEKLLGAWKFRAPQVCAGAINKTVAKGKTQIGRRLASEMQAPYGKIRKWIKALKASPHNLVGRIRMMGFRLKMIYTKQTPTPGGSYALRQVGEPVPLPHTPFQQTMLSGHKGWFTRTDPPRTMNRGRYAGKKRQPVSEIYADSPESLWRKAPAMAAEEIAKVQKDLERQILSQIDRFIK